MVRRCGICKIEFGAIPDVSIHCLPKNENLRTKWFANIGNEVSKGNGVCSQHFESKFLYYKAYGNIIKRFLMPEAVPTLLLGKPNSNNSHSEVKLACADTTNQLHTERLATNNINDKERDQNNTKKILIGKQNLIYTYMDNAEGSILSSENKTNFNSDEYQSRDQYTQSVGSECSSHKVLDQQNFLKRKSEVCSENNKKEKKLANPRFLGDLTRADFTNEESWRVVQQHKVLCQKKQKMLNQKIARLNDKIESFKSIMDHVNKTRLISNEGFNTLHVSD